MITPSFIEFGFDPEPFYSKGRPVFKQKKEMLKEIRSEFTEHEDEEENDDPFAFQMILDENSINAFLLDFVLLEKAFSVR